MPVTKGDILAIDAATLTQKEVHIVWQQSWQSRSQDYYLVTYTNVTRGKSIATLDQINGINFSSIATEAEKSGLLYIQKNMLDAFKTKKVTDQNEITFKVDDSFQYGQNSAQKNRWLAFHDKSQKMYQVCSILFFCISLIAAEYLLVVLTLAPLHRKHAHEIC
jgi:hypothetical protein